MTISTIIAIVLLGQLHFQISCRAELVYESEFKDDGRTVLLGGLFPMHISNGTGICGALYQSTVQRVESMVRTINSINDDSELLPRIKLAFIIRDTCTDPSYALQQAFQYIQTRNSNLTCISSSSDRVSVSGVIGAQFSQVSIDIANLFRLYRIPQISFISTADILGDKMRFDYFFRTVPPDSLQARAIADIIVLFNWTFVFMLYSDDVYGNGGIEALSEHLSLHNETRICVAVKISLSVTATSGEYDAAITTMSQDYVRNATVVVLFGHQDAAVGMMQALRRAHMQGDYTLSNLTWIGSDSWGNSLPSEYHSIAGTVLSFLPQARKDSTFDNYFTSLSPDNYSSNVWFNELWELKFGCSISSSKMCGMLQPNMTLNTTDFEQADHITLVSDTVLAFAHAIHDLVESRCPNSTLCDAILEERLLGKAINGELLRQQLYNISFQGPSSNIVAFSKDGTESGAYSIMNLKRNPMIEDTFTFETVGTWDHEQFFKFVSDIEWPTGGVPKSVCSDACEGGKQPIPIADRQCCWICSPCQSERGFSDGLSACQDCKESMMPDYKKSKCIPIPVSHLMLSHAWSIVLITFTILGQVATAFIFIVFLVYFKHGVVKASSRELSAILLVGLLLCYTVPFFFVAMPSPAVCAIRRVFFGLSFTVCFSALLVKTNRIYRIFNQKSLNTSKPLRFISPLSQVIITFFLIAFQVIVVIIWLVVDHPSTVIDYGTRSAELRCAVSPFVYLVASLGYNLILLLLSTYYAFLARRVPENFNEAKYINATVFTLCISWLAFISTYIGTIQFGTVFQVISLMITVISNATTTLVCIFVPRIVLLISRLIEKNSRVSSIMNAEKNQRNTISLDEL